MPSALPAPPPSARIWTYADVQAGLPETNRPTELWDGEIVLSPSPSFAHQELVDRFHDFLKRWVRDHHLGKTATAPLDMVLTAHLAVQPDVVFVSRARLGLIAHHLAGPADLVAEVLSPGSRRRDRLDKRDLYEQHGIPEYWLIDPAAATVEVLVLESGSYRLHGRFQRGDQASSRLLPGFSLPVSELFPDSPQGLPSPLPGDLHPEK